MVNWGWICFSALLINNVTEIRHYFRLCGGLVGDQVFLEQARSGAGEQ